MANKEDISITAADQGRINSFAKWNGIAQEFEAELADKKKTLTNLADLEDELIVSDVEMHAFKIGESFFHLTTDHVNSKMENQKEMLNKRVRELDAELSNCRTTMATLKKELYSKFGDNINLEDC